MAAMTFSNDHADDWAKLVDVAERRKIQNRIAQRNYRQNIKRRLAELERRKAAAVSHTTQAPQAQLPLSPVQPSREAADAATPQSSRKDSKDTASTQMLQYAKYPPTSPSTPYLSPPLDSSSSQYFNTQTQHVSHLSAEWPSCFADQLAAQVKSPTLTNSQLQNINFGYIPIPAQSQTPCDLTRLSRQPSREDVTLSSNMKFLEMDGQDSKAIDSGFASAEASLHIGSDHSTLSDYSVESIIGGQTPLHLATKRGHYNIVKLLLEKGVQVDSIDDSGKTPLHRAGEAGHEDVARLLIDWGANINAQIPNHRRTFSGGGV